MSRTRGETAPVVVNIEGLRVVSEANQREHWGAKNERRRGQRDAVLAALFVARLDTLHAGPGLVVRFHRCGPGLLDSDNLSGAFKHVRDAIAFWAGRDDADPWFWWDLPPTQERAKGYAVRIELEPMGAS